MDDDVRFVVAVNRQLLVDWAQQRGVIDPADFHVENRQLVRDREPLPG